MAKLADALALGASAARHAGSTPVPGMTPKSSFAKLISSFTLHFPKVS